MYPIRNLIAKMDTTKAVSYTHLFCWKDHIARFGFQGEKADRIAQAMMLGPIWPKLDLGLESDEDILEQFVAHTPELEQEIRLVFSDLSTIVREYEGSVDWIESLKARGYHTYYLSNYGERKMCIRDSSGCAGSK